jgi:hypothetical protein
VKPIKTAFEKDIIFSGKGRDQQSTWVGGLYSCGVPGSGREQPHNREYIQTETAEWNLRQLFRRGRLEKPQRESCIMHSHGNR